MSGPKSVEISQGIQERERDPVQEEVMKTRGMDIKDGAVAIVTSVGNGQVQGMKFVTRGGNLGSTIPLSQLVQGADAGVTLKLNAELEKLIGTAEGPGMRIIAGWLDSLEVAGDMTIVEEDEVKTLSPQGREERGVAPVKFSLRGLVIGDCKTALLYMSIIPVAAAEVRGKTVRWGVEIHETLEELERNLEID